MHSSIVTRTDLALETLFRGDDAWCLEKVKPSASLKDAVPLDHFLTEGGLQQTLADYQKQFGHCDRRACASFWSLYYFSALSIPFVLAAKQGTLLPIDPEAMTITVDETGLVKSFGLNGELEPFGSTDCTDAIEHLTTHHLIRAAKCLKDTAGLAPKLSLNNAAVYINYALKLRSTEAETQEPSDLFDTPHFPSGVANPFNGCLRSEVENGEHHCRRKICCLRYLLPGISGCGELCAKPELRKQ